MAAGEQAALKARVAYRWLQGRSLPLSAVPTLPVALVASLAPGDHVVALDGVVWSVMETSPSRIVLSEGHGPLVISNRDRGPYAWAYFAAPLLVGYEPSSR